MRNEQLLRMNVAIPHMVKVNSVLQLSPKDMALHRAQWQLAVIDAGASAKVESNYMRLGMRAVHCKVGRELGETGHRGCAKV